MLRELIEQEKIKPIERDLLSKPFSDLAEVRFLQGQLLGMRTVFSRLDFLTKEKPKNFEKDV
jgi:hypothetical protein